MSSDPFSRPEPGTEPDRPFGGILRVVAQVIGLGMILVGCWYGVGVLSDVVHFLRDPASMEGSILATAKLLGLEQIEVKVPGSDAIPLGRTAGCIGVIVWQLLAGLLSLWLIAAGGRLVHGVINERREFLQAMREFLVTLRHEGVAAAGAEEKKPPG